MELLVKSSGAETAFVGFGAFAKETTHSHCAELLTQGAGGLACRA